MIHRKSSRHSLGLRAFSLVELLVVVSVISLLIAILLPSLKRARDQSRMTVCLSNMKSQGSAVLMYAQDHTGSLPPKLVQFAQPSGGNSPLLINAFLARYQRQPFAEIQSGWPTPTGIWRCPDVSVNEDGSRSTDSGVLHAAPNRWLFNSMNIDEAAGRVTTWGDSLPGWEDRTERLGWSRMEQIRNPADIIALMDNVTHYDSVQHRREARESVGRSCDVITDPDMHSYCGENQGSHFVMRRRPAVFLDGHAEGVPFSSAFWMTLLEPYRPLGLSSGAIDLYAREVRHFMWFVEPTDAVQPGSD
ncbi:MAG: prepilin-type N-terminal cleavage/methylation domain-containing protein [Phycisphaerales bacterium]|nr:prepilin-type N-terminal cleavage/methylation domain-containing protein [Phycisphaerales bacterium]